MTLQCLQRALLPARTLVIEPAKGSRSLGPAHDIRNERNSVFTFVVAHETVHADHQFKVFGSTDQKALPSELFVRQCMISFDPDETAYQTYNNAFMKQVGRTAATDMELAEIVHDEETRHALSPADLTLLLHVDEAIKDATTALKERQTQVDISRKSRKIEEESMATSLEQNVKAEERAQRDLKLFNEIRAEIQKQQQKMSN